jgi:hypothetical protein
MDLEQLRRALTDVDLSNIQTLMREYADADGWQKLLESAGPDLRRQLALYVCPSRREEFEDAARQCGL